MKIEWEHFRDDTMPEAWYVLNDKGEPICGFYRCAENDHAFVIKGTGIDGAFFMIVSINQIIADVKAEAEMLLASFGWGASVN